MQLLLFEGLESSGDIKRKQHFYTAKWEIDLMCYSCHIRRLTKRWNSRRIWKICYVFNFQLKKIRSKIIQITLIELWSFISWCPKKQNLVAAFLSWKLKKRKIFQFRHQFGHFIKCQIWHELHISDINVSTKFDNPKSRYLA